MAVTPLFGTGNSTSATSAGASTLAVDKPANVADGDVLVIFAYCQFAGTVSSAPSGWSLATTLPSRAAGVYYKFIPTASGETDTSYSFTFSGSGRIVLQCFRVTGAEPSPLDAVGSDAGQLPGPGTTMPAVSPATADSLLLAFQYWNNSSTTVSTVTCDAAMTEGEEVATPTSGNTSGTEVSYQQISATGSTGTRAYTTSPASASQGGRMLAFKARPDTTTVSPSSAAASAEMFGTPALSPPWIALRGAGAVDAGTTSVSPVVPATATTGDLSVLTVAAKPYNTTITTPSGWTKIGEHTNGTTASGTDTGSMIVAVYVKESATPGAIGSIGQTNANSMSAVVNTYMKAPGTVWNHSTFTQGFDAVHEANYSATGDAGLSVVTGNVIVASTAVNADLGTITAQAVGGMSGATLTATNSRTYGDITAGNDHSILVVDVVVRSGSSDSAPTFTYTNSSSTSGTTIWLKLGLEDPPASLTVNPDAVASVEAFGTPTVSATLTSSPEGITPDEAFGTAVVSTTLTASPAAIDTSEAFGTATVNVAGPAVTVNPDAIASVEALGDPVVSVTLTASPAGIASDEAFGTASVTATLTVSPGGITTGEAFGTPVVTVLSGDLTISPDAIDSAETFGTASISTSLAAAATGIASEEAFGVPAASASLTSSPAEMASSEAFGTPSVSGSLTISPPSINTTETFGTATFTATLSMYADGIGPLNDFGSPTVTGGAQNFGVSPTGIPGAAAFGTPTVRVAAVAFPAGIAGGEAFGTPRISTVLVLRASDILPQAAFGTPVLRHGWHMSPTGVAGTSAIGTPTLSERLPLTIVGIPAPDPQFGNPKLAGSLLHFENDILGTLAPRRKSGKLDAPLTDADRGASRWRGTL